MIRSILRYIASTYFWVMLFSVSSVMFPLSLMVYLITAGYDRRLVVLHRFTCLWSHLTFLLNPLWKVTIAGRENINPNATYVIVSNHQSGADIMVLFRLYTHFKWIAKQSLFRIPFIGWSMWLNGYIALERGKTASMKKMMKQASTLLRERNSIMIFPEGTRSRDGKIQPFKSGAFHLALDNQVPILPVAISGTSMAIRKGGFLINRNHNIRVTVLKPIPYSQIRDLHPGAVGDLVRSEIINAFERHSGS